jgi:hypothetical protein
VRTWQNRKIKTNMSIDDALNARKCQEKIRLYTQYNISQDNSQINKPQLLAYFETLLKQRIVDRQDPTSLTYSAFLDSKDPITANDAANNVINFKLSLHTDNVPDEKIGMVLTNIFFDTDSVRSEQWKNLLGAKAHARLVKQGQNLWDSAPNVFQTKFSKLKPPHLKRIGTQWKNIKRNVGNVGELFGILSITTPSEIQEFYKYLSDGLPRDILRTTLLETDRYAFKYYNLGKVIDEGDPKRKRDIFDLLTADELDKCGITEDDLED